MLSFGLGNSTTLGLWLFPSILGTLLSAPFAYLLLFLGVYSGAIPTPITIPLVIILSLIFYFFIGASIGQFIGKIKARKENSSSV